MVTHAHLDQERFRLNGRALVPQRQKIIHQQYLVSRLKLAKPKVQLALCLR